MRVKILIGIELYTEGRYCALTGNGALGDVMTDHTAALAPLVSEYFPVRAGSDDDAADWNMEPVDEWTGLKSDTDLINKALSSMSAAAAFGGKASFKDLWTCDAAALARCYPDQGGRDFDASSADAALAQHLAFWTGKHHERILHLMKQSQLVRDKWDRDDYLRRTIRRACGMQGEVHKSKPAQQVAVESAIPVTPESEYPTDAGLRTGIQFMDPVRQLEHFKGCTYVSDLHRVLTPKMGLVKPEQFKVHFGGYTFALDSINDKTTRNAWEAFTESQVIDTPTAKNTCFKPDLKPGAVVTVDGELLVNTYVPIPVPRMKGDATPFTNHIAKMLPDKRDQQILISYMAAVLQHKGKKFTWCPLVQGVEGNGKSLLTRCLGAAIGRNYTHFPQAKNVDASFNSWLEGKILICVEDIYVPHDKRDIIENLKPMITGGYQEIQAKGVDQKSKDVCANFMLNSNHKDAVRKTTNERRFAIFYCKQQKVPDLERDGLTQSYFADLHDWINADGQAIITDFLESFQIPDEFNPATFCTRAPETSSTAEAISASAGRVEQEVIEAIESDRVGFCGGWISSLHFSNLLDDLRVKMSPQKRGKLIEELGFMLHPHLPKGRLCNPVAIDGGKPRLFIKPGNPAKQLQSPAKIAAAYEAAQGGTPTAAPVGVV